MRGSRRAIGSVERILLSEVSESSIDYMNVQYLQLSPRYALWSLLVLDSTYSKEALLAAAQVVCEHFIKIRRRLLQPEVIPHNFRYIYARIIWRSNP